jgi:hypothetical protein
MKTPMRLPAKARLGLLCVVVWLSACGDSSTGPEASGPYGLGLPEYQSTPIGSDSVLVSGTILVRTMNGPVAGVYVKTSATRGSVTPSLSKSAADGTVAITWRAPVLTAGEYMELRACVASWTGSCQGERDALMAVTGH